MALALCCIAMNNYTCTYACGNIFNTIIKTSGHSSLEKYTSHFIWKGSKGLQKVLSVRGELGTEQNCNILTPTLMATTAFLSRCPGLLNQGPGDQPLLGYGSHSSIFSPTDLNFLSPGLYNNLTSTYFLRASQFRTQFNSSTVKVAPGLQISLTGCTCYLHKCISYFDSLAGSEVNIQQLNDPRSLIRNQNKEIKPSLILDEL